MVQHIKSYVIIDLETTGLPFKERNRTKITEVSFIAVSRDDIIRTNPGKLPPLSKLTVTLNPKRKISTEAQEITGLTNDLLKYAPTFNEKATVLSAFLCGLPKPICLVAHNGYNFDFRILLTEFMEAKLKLPQDLLCVDSLYCFRDILKNNNYTPTIIPVEDDELMTDDEDDWGSMNITPEDWNELDNLCNSFSNISCNTRNGPPESATEIAKQTVKCKTSTKTKSEKKSYALTSLYKELLNKEVLNAHRAEDDCIMLLECVIATKSMFLPWVDIKCKMMSDIKPLIRG